MPPLLLKTVRFFVPAGMLYIALVAICWYSHWCDLAIPTQYDQIMKSIAAIIFGFLYSVSYLREYTNKNYYNEVNQNLMRQLTSQFEADPSVPKGISWSTIRPIFYGFVDNDESLKHQATLAYWNGALWTSSADLRAVSCIACIATGILMLIAGVIGDESFDFTRAIYFFILTIILFLISILFSRLTTNRHLSIGNEQCEFILVQKRQQLRHKLIGARQ
jgi:hypothetical protein